MNKWWNCFKMAIIIQLIINLSSCQSIINEIFIRKNHGLPKNFSMDSFPESESDELFPNQEISEIFDSLVDDMLNIKEKRETKEKHQENLGKLIRVDTNELCLIEIVQGMITEALNHCKDLKSTSMSEIVKQAYNYNKYSSSDKIERVVNIAKFIELLPQNEKKDALNTFYKEMRAKNHLNSMRVLIFNYIFEKSRILNSEITDEIQGFKDTILSSFTEFLTFNKNDSEFNQFLLLNSGNYFNYYSKQIILDALNQKNSKTKRSLDTLLDPCFIRVDATNRIKNILDNIRNFPHFAQSVDGLSYVCGYMIENNLLENRNILKLTYYVNSFLVEISTTNNTKLKRKLERINEKLPRNAVEFIRRPHNCKLKNKAHPSFLYADGQSKADTDRRNVFVLAYGSSGGYIPREGIWKFETSNNGESFRITNVRYNEYLYASDLSAVSRCNPGFTLAPQYNSHITRSSVFTWKYQTPSSVENEWEIIPRNGGLYFTLKNVYRNEYFFTDRGFFMNITRQHRCVFTWRDGTPTGPMWRESLWDIQC